MNVFTTSLIRSLEDATWFANGGRPIGPRSEIIQTPSWERAVTQARSREWDDFLLERANDLGRELFSISEQRLSGWNELADELRPVAREIVRAKAGHYETTQGLPKTLDQILGWTILHALLEAEYSDIRKPTVYGELANWIVKGHLPCGWIGAYPAGKLCVY